MVCGSYPNISNPKSLANGEGIAPEEKERRNGKRTMAYLETCDEKEGDFSSFTAIYLHQTPGRAKRLLRPGAITREELPQGIRIHVLMGKEGLAGEGVCV